MSLTVGSLFSGIGGLDLGLERAGMTVIWQSEIDPYACRVLAKHWPDVPNLGDITTIDWGTVEQPDLICGGYPCQPFSAAGIRQGESDPRHLWPKFRDALDVLRPQYALLENVPGHLSLGFGRVLGDLAELGFDAEWACIPASAVGAPHLRYRVFVLADAYHGGRNGRPRKFRTDGRRQLADSGSAAAMADPSQLHGNVRNDHAGSTRSSALRATGPRDIQPGNGDGVTPSGVSWWSVEPDVGRVAHGVPHRVDRLRCLGNAVVPQVAELIGRRILKAAA